MVAQWAGRRRDRPARLVRRADDLHVVGLPHRQAVPRAARRPLRPRCTTTSSRAPTPSPTSTPTPTSRASGARDAARVGLVELVQAIMDGRAGEPPPEKEDRDLLDVLMSIKDEDGSPRFSADIITGMFISMMFAGHHTTSGTAAWTLIELLRDPDYLAEVRRGARRALAGGDPEVSYQALREMPQLEAAIKEALRLHPPLIILLRVAKVPVEVGGYTIQPREDGGGHARRCRTAIPRPSPMPRRSTPSRYLEPRRGRRRQPVELDPVRRRPPPLRRRRLRHDAAQGDLLGAAARLVRFELAQPPETYRNDHSKMVVQLAQPCAARMTPDDRSCARIGMRSSAPNCGRGMSGWRIVVDRDLCQGHGVCESRRRPCSRCRRTASSPCSTRRPPDRARRRSRPP